MEYRTIPQYFQCDNVALASAAGMRVSKGDGHMAISATQFLLKVELSVNGCDGQFQLVENVLRSLLAGRKWAEFNVDSYTQEDSQFVVRFAPPGNHTLTKNGRREVEEVRAKLDFAHLPTAGERVFPEMIELADYAFTGIMRTFGRLAPAVFDEEKGTKLGQILPLLRPLKIGLHLDHKNRSLEKLAEHGVLKAVSKPKKKEPPPTRFLTRLPRLIRSNRGRVENVDDPPRRQDHKPRSLLSDEPWTEAGEFFGTVDYFHRTFVVLIEGGDDIHEPFFLSHTV